MNRGMLITTAVQATRTIDPFLLSIGSFIVGFLAGVTVTLIVKQTTFTQKHLVNGVGVAILLIWTLSVVGEMRYVDYTTPLYIHLIAGMAAGSILEVQNAMNGLGGGTTGKK